MSSRVALCSRSGQLQLVPAGCSWSASVCPLSLRASEAARAVRSHTRTQRLRDVQRRTTATLAGTLTEHAGTGIHSHGASCTTMPHARGSKDVRSVCGQCMPGRVPEAQQLQPARARTDGWWMAKAPPFHASSVSSSSPSSSTMVSAAKLVVRSSSFCFSSKNAPVAGRPVGSWMVFERFATAA